MSIKKVTSEEMALKFLKLHGLQVSKEIVERGKIMKSTYFDTKKMEFFSGTPFRNGIDAIRIPFVAELDRLLMLIH